VLESVSGKEQRIKKSRFMEAQIAFALRQAESGIPVAEIIRYWMASKRWTGRFRILTALCSVM